nr:hypothetical protein [Tanacetum cinerariifolium]
FRFCINSKSSNKVYVIVVVDLSNVANPLYLLRDKDLFKSKDPQVVVTVAKLPILNPNEFDLWKMRTEQFFLMTYYSLWEVILNGDSPLPTRIVDGAVQTTAPTTAEQRLAKKNELKARGTLLMALARILFPPLDNPELTIRRRSPSDPTLLNNSEMATEGNGDLPVPDLQTMEELCQPSLNGRGGPIAPIAIQEMNFGLNNDMIQQDTSAQWSESSSFITSSSDTEIAALKAEMVEINKNLMRVLQFNQQVKAVAPNCETCGGPHSFNDCPATVGNTQNVNAAGPTKIPQPQVVTTNEFTNFMKANDSILKNMQTNMTSLTNLNLELKNMFRRFMKMNTASSSGSRTLPGNTITNPKVDLKGMTSRSGTAYQGPTIPTTSSSPVVERETEVSASRPNQRLSIPYPSRLQDHKLRDKANDQREKFFQIFKDLNFNISFTVALILMPKFGPSIKSLLTNKDKLSQCLALADLGASINLMPLSAWNKLSLPDLSPTCMTLELTDRLISRLAEVAEDVFVKVGTFHFSVDFLVVDFDADPRVPIILRRSFLKSGRALIDVFEGKLTLRVGKEAITFNLNQTSRYSANYNDMTANRIDVIDMACEAYSQEVLGFSDVITSGNPTPYYDPFVSTTSPTLTPFENSDFFLEEVDAFLALKDDPTSLEVDQSYVDTEGDILLLEAFLNDDPSLPPPNQGNYMPEVRKELKICEAKSDKSSIDEPPKVELKDLPPHIEYAFLEGDDKLSVIIVKDLSVEEKTALITVLKSHKRAIAQKLSDIKGIDPEFCTNKILMEKDFEPAVQHQRRVNPKIYDVIKQEVLKNPLLYI